MSGTPHNFLLAPAALGDPILSFDFHFGRCLLVSGTATGMICLWPAGERMKNLSESDRLETQRRVNEKKFRQQSKQGQLAANSAHNTNNRSLFLCRMLERASQEGVKHIFFQQGSEGGLFAIVGDLHLKYWHSVDEILSEIAVESAAENGSAGVAAASPAAAASPPLSSSAGGGIAGGKTISAQVLTFHRNHSYSLCATSYTLRCGNKIALISNAIPDQQIVNVESMEEKNMSLTIRHAVPLSFIAPNVPDELPSFVPGVKAAGGSSAAAASSASSAASAASASSSDSSSSSAGKDFAPMVLCLEQSAESGEKCVHVYDLSTQSLLSSVSFSRVHKFYWGFQLGAYGQRMAHVCCQNKIKVWDLRNPKAPLFKVRGHAASARVLAIYYSLDGKTLLSLGSDRKLIIWDAENGKEIRVYKNVLGEFRLGYPYLLTKIEEAIFYTADEGIYALVDAAVRTIVQDKAAHAPILS